MEQAERDLKIKQDKIIEQAQEKANLILNNTRYNSSKLLNELEEIKKQFNEKNASQNLDKARRDYKNTLQNLENIANPVIENQTAGEGIKNAPKIGDIVILKSFNRDATVIKVEEEKKRAYVVSGLIKMWVGFDELLIKKSSISTEKPKTRNVTGIKSRADINIKSEIDIRGLATDEAILELDKYIDNAVLAGINTITIIHGKGTGTLRKNVQAHLRKHKNIKNFRVGLFGEGENGVTIAEIKE